MKNIAQLSEDDVPESILSTMEQNIDVEEIQTEHDGYVPAPLSDPTEYINTEAIPISNR